MKNLPFYILLSFVALFVLSCNKTTKPENNTISGKVSFFDADGNVADTTITATISLYYPESLADSISIVQQEYPFVGPTFNPILYSDYRLLGDPIATCETDETGNFSISSLSKGEYLLVYSATNFGWHQQVCNVPYQSALNLNMRQTIKISGQIDTQETTWGPDQFVIIENDIYFMENNNLKILDNTIVSLNNAQFVVLGNIDITGTNNQPVIFTSSLNTPTMGDWRNIQITNDESLISISYCIIRWGTFGIVNDANIQLNNIAMIDISMDGYTSAQLGGNINNLLFYNCQYGMNIDQTENLNINKSIIMKNREYGMRLHAASPEISNSIFLENPSHIVCKNLEGTTTGSSPTIKNCLFKSSDMDAIYAFRFCHSIISKNEFIDNYYDIRCQRAYDFATGDRLTANNNNFTQAKGYVFRLNYDHGSNGIINAQRNWWNATNETEIQNLIWDETDEPGGDDVGTVDYSNWKTSKVSGTGPQNN